MPANENMKQNNMRMQNEKFNKYYETEPALPKGEGVKRLLNQFIDKKVAQVKTSRKNDIALKKVEPEPVRFGTPASKN